MKYIEIQTIGEAEILEVLISKAKAQSDGKPYPIPPDIVGPGKFPCNLSVATTYENLTPEQANNCPKQEKVSHVIEGTGGVYLIAIGPELEALNGVIVDGETVNLSNMKAKEALNVETLEIFKPGAIVDV